MVTTNHMKNYIQARYPNKTWRDKVEKMSINQIMAVYYSLVERKIVVNENDRDQMTIFDIMRKEKKNEKEIY